MSGYQRVPGEVQGLNFKIVGGEASEGEITALKFLHSSNYSDPLNALGIYKPQAVFADFEPSNESSIPIRILERFGTNSNRSVMSVEGLQYFQGSDANFYVTDFKDLRLISAKIKGNVDAISQSSLNKTTVMYDNRSIHWSVWTSASAGKTLTYNIDNSAWSEQSFRFGVAAQLNPATDILHPSLPSITVLFTHTDSAKVYVYPFAFGDVGINISIEIKTKWYGFQPDWFKKITSIRTFKQTDTDVFPVKTFIYRDFSATPTESLSLATTGLTNQLQYFRTTPVGKTFQLRFTTSTAELTKFGGWLLGYTLHHQEGY
jgi:hypothetical protein